MRPGGGPGLFSLPEATTQLGCSVNSELSTRPLVARWPDGASSWAPKDSPRTGSQENKPSPARSLRPLVGYGPRLQKRGPGYSNSFLNFSITFRDPPLPSVHAGVPRYFLMPPASREASHGVPRRQARPRVLSLPRPGGRRRQAAVGSVAVCLCPGDTSGRHSASTEAGRSRRVVGNGKARNTHFTFLSLCRGLSPDSTGNPVFLDVTAQQPWDEGDGSQRGMTRCHSHVSERFVQDTEVTC